MDHSQINRRSMNMKQSLTTCISLLYPIIVSHYCIPILYPIIVSHYCIQLLYPIFYGKIVSVGTKTLIGGTAAAHTKTRDSTRQELQVVQHKQLQHMLKPEAALDRSYRWYNINSSSTH